MYTYFESSELSRVR